MFESKTSQECNSYGLISLLWTESIMSLDVKYPVAGLRLKCATNYAQNMMIWLLFDESISRISVDKIPLQKNPKISVYEKVSLVFF